LETAAISHRVADFLKNHPPFHAMEEGDLLDLSRQGRVRFFEANEYIVWQGEPYQMKVFVIQQGTVSLWDESGEAAVLRDVRGAGDMLGIEQFNDGGSYAYSARSSSDVVIYMFPAIEFEALVLKYPYAIRFAAAYSNVSGDYQSTEERRDPAKIFLHELTGRKKLLSCGEKDSIRDVVRLMRATGADSIAVLDSDRRARAVLTANSFLEWIDEGGEDSRQPISGLLRTAPVAMAPDASVTDGVLAMGIADADALVITSDGTSGGRLNAIVTSRDLGPVFGDQPVEILREIPFAADMHALRDLNHRVRAFVLQHLTGAPSVDWLSRFTTQADVCIVKRIIALLEAAELPVTWCFCGPPGRGESLTRVHPPVIMIVEHDHDRDRSLDAYRRLSVSLAECGYLPAAAATFEAPFFVASLSEWKQRFEDWVRDPIFKEMDLARHLFDLRPIYGNRALWHKIETTVADAVNPDFLQVLANDCMTSLPPLTFFHDAVVNEVGEETSVFRLERNALLPLVDVGRVFGIAAKRVLASSTLERFALARALMPEHESIFRNAAETFRIVLWQQGRIGISQGTDGAELPPALLSRFDRQILKSGFRSILRLLEFTADPKWLKTL
jgi:CBS domain-containing protein